MIIEELYDALIDAGATEEKARSAARAVAAFDARFNKIEADLGVIKWMLGTVLALAVAILFRVFH